MDAKNSVNLDAKMLELVRQRADKLVGKFGFRESDREDIEQELTLHLLECLPKIGQDVKNRRAFINRILRNHSITLVRQQKAEKCDDEDVVSLNMLVDDEGNEEKTTLGNTLLEDVHSRRLGTVPRSDLDHVDLVQDVATVLGQLPADLRDLCVRLQCQSLSQIARETGIPRTTLCDSLQKIRNHFEEAGMRDYL